MKRLRLAPFVLAAGALLAAAVPSLADELRNVKPGEPVPAFKLPTIDDAFVDSAALKGSVMVVVYLSAEQRSSELAAAESTTVVGELKGEPVQLVHVTADAINKAYFQKFRTEHKLATPLGFDADRTLYHQLGMIVFPTTLVVDKEGKLVHVISLRGPDYTRRLDAFVRHALGQYTEAQVAEHLKAAAGTESATHNLSSAHRAAARLFREKGRPDAAREELLKAREQDPSDVESALDLADLDLVTGQLDEADKIVNDLLKVQPEHRRAKQLLGICYFRRGQLHESEQVLLEALKLNPEPGRIHYYLGRIYEQEGDTAKALEQYRAALQKALNEPEPAAAPAPSSPAPASK